MPGSSYDLILEIFAQFIEIITVSGYTYNQISMLFGFFLRLQKSFRGHYIELYMMSVHPEIATDQVGDFFHTFLAAKERRREFLIKQGCSCAKMIDLCGRFQHGCGTVTVCSLYRGDTFREGLS